MFSSEDLIYTGISTILALITSIVAQNIFPKYGEIFGMQVVFPLIVLVFYAILKIIFFIGKLLWGEGVKKNNNKKSLKNRSKK